MIIKNNPKGRVIIEYGNNYPIEPIIIEADNCTISGAKLKVGGKKAPLWVSLKSAWIAFRNVRYGQFADYGYKHSMIKLEKFLYSLGYRGIITAVGASKYAGGSDTFTHPKAGDITWEMRRYNKHDRIKLQLKPLGARVMKKFEAFINS